RTIADGIERQPHPVVDAAMPTRPPPVGALRSRRSRRAHVLRRHIAALHGSAAAVDDERLDARIGSRSLNVDAGLQYGDLAVRYGLHRTYQGDLPYATIREIFRRFDPPAQATLLDLGCGYGRLVFYGALLRGARVTGIELVCERVKEAQRVQRSLGLRGV